MTEEPVWELDADADSADWIKAGTWDLPPYKSAEFFEIVSPASLDRFRRGVAYRAAVDRGQIRDDEWVADYVK